MKKVLLLVVLCAIGSYDLGIEAFEELNEALQLKCVKNTNNIKIAHQFKTAYENYTECTVEKIKNNQNKAPFVVVNNVCEANTNINYQECLITYTEKISICLDETEAFIPKLILNGDAASYKHFFCSADRTSDLEYLTKSANNACIKSEKHSVLAAIAKCQSDLVTLKDLDKGTLHFDKHVLYRDLLQLKKCWNELLTRNCNNDYSRFVELRLGSFISELELLIYNSSPGIFSNLLTMVLISISLTLLVKIF